MDKTGHGGGGDSRNALFEQRDALMRHRLCEHVVCVHRIPLI
jgi:hypothetical protein